MDTRVWLAAACTWGKCFKACNTIVLFLSAVVVMGETCQFPPDHPIQNLTVGQTVPVTEMERYHVYIYDRTFGDCRGCVRSLTFCYKPGSSNELMTVEIRMIVSFVKFV